MKKNSQQGYIMVLALMLIALIVILVTNIADKSMVHIFYLKTMINREKAKMIAMSGMQISMSQLANMEFDSKSKKKKDKKKENLEEKAKQFIRNFLPISNRWQKFKLTKKDDGVVGELKICIGCEDGKININHLFDFSNKKFFSDKIDCKKAVRQVFDKVKNIIGGESLFSKFEKFAKERQYKLYDPTELLNIKEFKTFKSSIFFDPDGFIVSDEKKVKQTIYLNDLFTLWSFSRDINPWFLSNSLKVLFGFKILKSGDSKLNDKSLQENLKQFKLKLIWSENWKKLLLPIYGKEFSSLPKEIGMLMSTKFEPRVFSVLSYGTVGNVTQKLLVILERVTKKESSGSISFEFRAKKFYWL